MTLHEGAALSGLGRYRGNGGARAAIALAATAALLAPAWSCVIAGDKSVAPAVARILTLDADAELGSYLAGTCVACHRQQSAPQVIPPIAGLEKERFVTALVEYKTGARTNAAMMSVASSLGDPEIAALAMHFHGLGTQ